ncbi:MAG: hypothetical protein HC837_08030 [Chloroflexaceae bacterium]|nr:hypothetical protein [Chloroflexaceae bacterium]
MLLAYACAINTSKPLLSISALRHADIGALVTDSIWGKTDWGRDRYYYAREHFGDDRVPTILAALPPDSRVALVATIRSHWIYHYLLGRPDVSFAVLSRGLNSRLKEGQQAAWDAVHRDYDYLLCMGDTCQSLVQHGHGTVEQEYAGQLTTTLLRLVVPPAPE